MELIGKLFAILWLTKILGVIKFIIILIDIYKKNPREYLLEFRFNNKNIKFYIESKRSDLSFLTEIFFFQSYQVKSDLRPKLIIDIGANKGDSAIYFASLFPSAEIHCFEPNENILSILKKNLAINNINAKIIPKAVSNKSGVVYFENATNHLYSKISKKPTNMKVNEVTLSSLYKNSKIDILKIDAEGEEPEIVDDILAKNLNINVLVCEIHYSAIDGVDFLKKVASKFKIMPPLFQYKFLNSNVIYPIVVGKSI